MPVFTVIKFKESVAQLITCGWNTQQILCLFSKSGNFVDKQCNNKYLFYHLLKWKAKGK